MNHKKKIVVIGDPHHTQRQHQIEMLKQMGAEVINMNPSGLKCVYEQITWENDKVIWAEQDISPETVHSVLVANYAPDMPTQHVFDESEDKKLGWEGWWRAYALQRDRSDTVLSYALSCEAAGVKMVNNASKSLTSRRKPFQITQIQATGAPMPETLVTNNPEAAQLFIQQHEHVIAKPAAGGALTIDAKQLTDEHFTLLRETPAIFQERIFGDDLRVMVLEGKVISCAAINVPEDTLDFRGNEQYQRGYINYKEYQLPAEIEAYCGQITQRLGLRFGGIDIKRTEDDQYYFLECNSSPIYLDVERKLKHPITEQLCLELLAN